MDEKTRIVFVDDEPDLGYLLRAHYATSPLWEVVFFTSPTEALPDVRDHPETAIVATDLSMPDMDGHQFLQALRQEFPQVFTLVVSAYGDMPNIRQAMNDGAFDYIMKPISFVDLELTLTKTMRTARRVRQEMREKELLRRAVECAPVGITITDTDGRILYMNQTDAAMHGYALREMLGQPSTLLGHGTPRPPDLDAAGVWERERNNQSKDGRVFPVLLKTETITDPGGRFIGRVTVCEELTEQQQVIRHLRTSIAILTKYFQRRTKRKTTWVTPKT